MIVDDQPFNILAINNILEKWDLEGEPASNGEIAVKMFKESFKKRCKCKYRHYRLILMDLEMPVMNGIEASEKIFEIINRSHFNVSANNFDHLDNDDEEVVIVFQTANTSKLSL